MARLGGRYRAFGCYHTWGKKGTQCRCDMSSVKRTDATIVTVEVRPAVPQLAILYILTILKRPEDQ